MVSLKDKSDVALLSLTLQFEEIWDFCILFTDLQTSSLKSAAHPNKEVNGTATLNILEGSKTIGSANYDLSPVNTGHKSTICL